MNWLSQDNSSEKQIEHYTELLEHTREQYNSLEEVRGSPKAEAQRNQLFEQIKQIKEDFWENVKITGHQKELNTELEKALRLADFIDLGLLMCTDALQRDESCGAHFREEYQTEEGEAVRVDDDYAYVSAWEYASGEFKLHKEPLSFQFVKPTVRSYK